MNTQELISNIDYLLKDPNTPKEYKLKYWNGTLLNCIKKDKLSAIKSPSTNAWDDLCRQKATYGVHSAILSAISGPIASTTIHEDTPAKADGQESDAVVYRVTYADLFEEPVKLLLCTLLWNINKDKPNTKAIIEPNEKSYPLLSAPDFLDTVKRIAPTLTVQIVDPDQKADEVPEPVQQSVPETPDLTEEDQKEPVEEVNTESMEQQEIPAPVIESQETTEEAAAEAAEQPEKEKQQEAPEQASEPAETPEAAQAVNEPEHEPVQETQPEQTDTSAPVEEPVNKPQESAEPVNPPKEESHLDISDKSPEVIERAANRIYNEAVDYENGTGGKPKDLSMAFHLFKNAADMGCGPAQNAVAGYYLQGNATEVNYAKAKYYYELASMKDIPAAWNGLGCIYGNGLGVPKDMEKACHLFQIAVAAGYQPAAENYTAAKAQLKPESDK